MYRYNAIQWMAQILFEGGSGHFGGGSGLLEGGSGVLEGGSDHCGGGCCVPCVPCVPYFRSHGNVLCGTSQCGEPHPCGILSHGVTSLKEQIGEDVNNKVLISKFMKNFNQLFKRLN